ncbi:DUF2087 domain-containing protein [Glutamicibacter arilaitensis]|uniref:DUF2087 domain-containing protein n=1 Tax=Glutamicibacter arilaitensis TaxID=256701 RepID=UPI00384E9FB5
MSQGNKWIEIAAGLKNQNMRTALGLVLAGAQDQLNGSTQTTKDLQRWVKIGLLTEHEGRWQLNDQMLNETLASAASSSTQRTGVMRYFTGPRLNTLPARPADRHEVMVHIRDHVLFTGESLREEQLNERLRVIHADVALLRRYLVDYELVLRDLDGTDYRLPAK